MLTPEEHSKLEKKCDKIFKEIMNTDTNHRGNLLLMVADRLKKNSQFYTANVFEKAGIDYNTPGN